VVGLGTYHPWIWGDYCTVNVTVPTFECNNKPYRAPERLCRNFQYDGRRFWGSRIPAWNRIAVEKEYKRTVPPGS
jgi:hypothetical protein